MNGMAIEDRPAWYAGVKRRGSPQKGRQTTMLDHVVPPLSSTEEVRFQRELSLAFYQTGTSFQRIENSHFRAALQVFVFHNDWLFLADFTAWDESTE